MGFRKLVAISDSPLAAAVVQSNPGGAKLKRGTYHRFLTSVAEGWKSLFESEDLLIKALPTAR